MPVYANRRVQIGEIVYEAGDEVLNHDFAHQLVRYGFADAAETPAPSEPTTAPSDDGDQEEQA